jgi:hypothetical protein
MVRTYSDETIENGDNYLHATINTDYIKINIVRGVNGDCKSLEFMWNSSGESAYCYADKNLVYNIFVPPGGVPYGFNKKTVISDGRNFVDVHVTVRSRTSGLCVRIRTMLRVFLRIGSASFPCGLPFYDILSSLID